MDPYIGEIRTIAFSFAPRQWSFCDGSLLEISGNESLFSLISSTYGGNGRTNFALPRLNDRAPMGQGSGPGLTPTYISQMQGLLGVSLYETQMPSHSHAFNASKDAADNAVPSGLLPAKVTTGRSRWVYADPDPSAATELNPAAISTAGESMGHQNTQPYLGLNFIMALDGVYPPRP